MGKFPQIPMGELAWPMLNVENQLI